MASTCGDGWKAADEACDDKNGLASGGCNADCSASNAGFVCGERAEGCTAVAEGEGEGEGEDEGEGEGEGEGEDEGKGCAATPPSLFAALLVLLVRRRRQR